ncbi:MAG: glycosyltransferase family 2 protein [Chitinophagaceae bacterium]|nr:glycosyltransferase family 2 protein [Chitinophagaceae bacterium]
MKVSGFTFVKNAVKYGYPVVESIRSILPLVDEMIVSLGDSEDETNALIASIGSDKIKIIHSVWDKTLLEGGKVLAVETDKAMDATATDSDWLFYIQADEVLHEQYHPVIWSAMEKYKDDKRVAGLLFNYHHFYGSYRYIGDGREWYSKEIRVIRNDKGIRSYRDAQGFRWKNDDKLQVKLIDAFIYHYGWVRNPVTMYRKRERFGKMWDGQGETEAARMARESKHIEFDYSKIDSVTVFNGTHPQVMKDLMSKEDWTLEMDVKKKNFKNMKHRILYFLWRKFGWRPFEYRNFKRI